MNLLKFLGRIGQGAMTGLRMDRNSNNWTKIKSLYEKNTAHKTGPHKLHLNHIHVRNGSRGNGIGMGHQNKINRTK